MNLKSETREIMAKTIVESLVFFQSTGNREVLSPEEQEALHENLLSLDDEKFIALYDTSCEITSTGLQEINREIIAKQKESIDRIEATERADEIQEAMKDLFI